MLLMEYKEEDFLIISDVQRFAFCRRNWALATIEQLWEENLYTVEGDLLHENCHDPSFTESRKDVRVTRAMPIFSRTLGASGECDVVEFHKAERGIALAGKSGQYEVYPVEYKRGEPKNNEADILQLTAQAICLEEMLMCEIIEGAIFYSGIKRRLKVDLTNERKEQVRALFVEMHGYLQKGFVPKGKPTKACNGCSLKNRCLPKLLKIGSAQHYLERTLGVEGDAE